MDRRTPPDRQYLGAVRTAGFDSNYSILFQGKSKYYFIINIVCSILNEIHVTMRSV
jgi:hypothetical protein